MLLLTTLVAPLPVLACGSASPEQQVLIDFVHAARLRDSTTLANLAAVPLDPRLDGSVQQFTVATMGPETRSPLAGGRAVAVTSLTPPGRPDVDVSNLNVDMITKQVTVNAQVRMPDGQVVPRTLVFTLQRGVARQGNQTIDGRWIVTGLR